MNCPPSGLLLFLGPIGGPELVMIALVILILTAPVVLTLLFVLVFLKPKSPQIPTEPLRMPGQTTDPNGDGSQ